MNVWSNCAIWRLALGSSFSISNGLPSSRLVDTNTLVSTITRTRLSNFVHYRFEFFLADTAGIVTGFAQLFDQLRHAPTSCLALLGFDDNDIAATLNAHIPPQLLQPLGRD